MKNVKNTVQQILSERRQHKRAVVDLLSLLLEATDEQNGTFTDEEIGEEIMTFLVVQYTHAV